MKKHSIGMFRELKAIGVGNTKGMGGHEQTGREL